MATAPFLLLMVAVVPRCDAGDTAVQVRALRAVPPAVAVVHADAADVLKAGKAGKHVAKAGKIAKQKAVVPAVRVKRPPRAVVAVIPPIVAAPQPAPRLAPRYEPHNPRGPPVA